MHGLQQAALPDILTGSRILECGMILRRNRVYTPGLQSWMQKYLHNSKSCKRGLNILLFNIEQHDAYQYIDVVEVSCVDCSSRHRSTLYHWFAESG